MTRVDSSHVFFECQLILSCIRMITDSLATITCAKLHVCQSLVTDYMCDNPYRCDNHMWQSHVTITCVIRKTIDSLATITCDKLQVWQSHVINYRCDNHMWQITGVTITCDKLHVWQSHVTNYICDNHMWQVTCVTITCDNHMCDTCACH